MLHTNRSSRLLFLALCLAFCPAAAGFGQSSSAAPAAFTIPVELVLTPEFCGTKIRKGSFLSGRETFEVGKAACPELEKTLKETLPGLARLSREPEAGDRPAGIILIPRFVDAGATKTVGAFSDREFVVLVEWTAKDAAGKALWIETVQGSAKAHMGNVFTAGGNRKGLNSYCTS
jgi:hypothetical protein